MLVALVYGLFGMQLLMGKLEVCSDGSVSSAAECTGRFTLPSGKAATRHWVPSDLGNFDSIGWAILTLFEMMTLEGWPDVMWAMVDTTEAGAAPVEGASPWLAMYAVSWVVVSAFFLLNLFIGVILENFNEIR